jgi:hypothetical protein
MDRLVVSKGRRRQAELEEAHQKELPCGSLIREGSLEFDETLCNRALGMNHPKMI